MAYGSQLAALCLTAQRIVRIFHIPIHLSLTHALLLSSRHLPTLSTLFAPFRPPSQVFDDDKVRWKCAWDLLVTKGWVVLLPEFGYVVPSESRILNHIPLVATAEGRLWER